MSAIINGSVPPLSKEWIAVKQAQDPANPHDQVFIVPSTDRLTIQAWSNQLASGFWVITPELNEYIISHLTSLKVSTVGRMQKYVSDESAGSWSWYDLAVLDRRDATEPKIVEKKPLVWLANELPFEARDRDVQQTSGVFDRAHEIFEYLKPGDFLAIRACARFGGWVNDASNGSIEMRLSKTDEGNEPQPNKAAPADKSEQEITQAVQESNFALQKLIQAFLIQVSPGGVEPIQSTVTDSLSTESSTDPAKVFKAQASQRPLRLLSLDGGGVRGISSLVILKHIMEKIPGAKGKKPCEVFDMICGTSTGGLIAIMLGRLRMDIDECIASYKDLSKGIFGGWVESLVPGWPWPMSWFKRQAALVEQFTRMAWNAARYSDDGVKQSIQVIVKKHSGKADAPMLDYAALPEKEHRCKVFVLACKGHDVKEADHLRTYVHHGAGATPDLPIWVAARATSAAPSYFPTMTWPDEASKAAGVLPIDYLDAGLGFNNPVMMLLSEARSHYEARPIGCLISIGTGMAPKTVINLPKKTHNPITNLKGLFGVQSAIVDAYTSGEQAHKLANAYFDELKKQPKLFPAEQNAYFRFNPGKQTQGNDGEWGTRDDDWEKLVGLGDYNALSDLENWAMGYMALADPASKVEECAARLAEKWAPPSTAN